MSYSRKHEVSEALQAGGAAGAKPCGGFGGAPRPPAAVEQLGRQHTAWWKGRAAGGGKRQVS